MLKLIGVLFLVVVSQAEIFEGQCRSIEEYGGVVSNFNYVAYSGNWFQIEKYKNHPFKPIDKTF